MGFTSSGRTLIFDEEASGNIAAGATFNFTLFPPVGEIWIVYAAQISIVSGVGTSDLNIIYIGDGKQDLIEAKVGTAPLLVLKTQLTIHQQGGLRLEAKNNSAGLQGYLYRFFYEKANRAG